MDDQHLKLLGSIVARLDSIDKNLELHMRRTENLEERFAPVEFSVKFQTRLATFFYGIGVAVITAMIIRWFSV